ncbi:MAG: thioredoxin family protein [Planctomycetota bacterium]
MIKTIAPACAALLAVSTLTLLPACQSPGAAPTPLAFSSDAATDLPGAVARAEREGKVVVAIATADWCPPCQAYKRNALADADVNAWLDANAVALNLDVTDAESAPPAASTLGVRSIPATYVVSADGRVLASRVGALSAPELIDFLESATN